MPPDQGCDRDLLRRACRRDPDHLARPIRTPPPRDQVMTVFTKDQYTLVKTQDWDTLGMRGTCSDGFLFTGEAPAEQIFPKPFAEIAAQSMLANAHILWSGVWYGIAVDAVARAQAFVRAAARKTPGRLPPGALRLAEVSNLLQMMKSNVVAGRQGLRGRQGRRGQALLVGFAVAMNNVKIASSETILEIINHAMLICGIMGYKNGTPVQPRPASARRAFRAAHDLQRPNPRQHVNHAPDPQAGHQPSGVNHHGYAGFASRPALSIPAC